MEKYIIKTFDKDYGSYMYIADSETCNLSQRIEEAETFNTKEECIKVINELNTDFPESTFEAEEYTVKLKAIYMVVQHQMDTEYDNKTIALYSDKEKAVEKCKELNKEYAENVTWVKDEEYVNVDTFDEFYHYYTVDCLYLDDPKNNLI